MYCWSLEIETNTLLNGYHGRSKASREFRRTTPSVKTQGCLQKGDIVYVLHELFFHCLSSPQPVVALTFAIPESRIGAESENGSGAVDRWRQGYHTQPQLLRSCWAGVPFFRRVTERWLWCSTISKPSDAANSADTFWCIKISKPAKVLNKNINLSMGRWPVSKQWLDVCPIVVPMTNSVGIMSKVNEPFPTSTKMFLLVWKCSSKHCLNHLSKNGAALLMVQVQAHLL